MANIILDEIKKQFTALKDQKIKLRDLHRSGVDPWKICETLASSGAMGCLIPKEYGGLGLNMNSLSEIFEAWAASGYFNALPLLTQMGIICLVRHGNEEQKKSLLPKLAKGEWRSCVAATEEVSGMNMFRIQTFAEHKGDHYLVNGSKMYISGFDLTEKALLLVRTKTTKDIQKEGLPKIFGLSVFYIDTKSDGITMEELPTRGEPGLKQFRLQIKNLKIPAENLVGPQDAGAMVMFDAMNLERLLAASLALGLSQHCLEVATKYAQERIVFGKNSIGHYQSIQHPLADVRIREESVRLLIQKGCALFDQNEDPTEVGFAANCAKYLGAQLGLLAVDAAIETLGGKGFSEDYDLIHLWESARLFKTAPTSNNMILNFVAEQNLGLPRSY